MNNNEIVDLLIKKTIDYGNSCVVFVADSPERESQIRQILSDRGLANKDYSNGYNSVKDTDNESQKAVIWIGSIFSGDCAVIPEHSDYEASFFDAEEIIRY